jgi:hypothetical protein
MGPKSLFGLLKAAQILILHFSPACAGQPVVIGIPVFRGHLAACVRERLIVRVPIIDQRVQILRAAHAQLRIVNRGHASASCAASFVVVVGVSHASIVAYAGAVCQRGEKVIISFSRLAF